MYHFWSSPLNNEIIISICFLYFASFLTLQCLANFQTFFFSHFNILCFSCLPLPQVLTHHIFVIIQLKIGSDFHCNFFDPRVILKHISIIINSHCLLSVSSLTTLWSQIWSGWNQSVVLAWWPSLRSLFISVLCVLENVHPVVLRCNAFTCLSAQTY